MPRQLGPMKGKAASLAMATILSWRSWLPTSPKPPEMTTAERTFAPMQAVSTSGTRSALTAITAKSTGSGTSAMLG